jgi:hypothetical protein
MMGIDFYMTIAQERVMSMGGNSRVMTGSAEDWPTNIAATAVVSTACHIIPLQATGQRAQPFNMPVGLTSLVCLMVFIEIHYNAI